VKLFALTNPPQQMMAGMEGNKPTKNINEFNMNQFQFKSIIRP